MTSGNIIVSEREFRQHCSEYLRSHLQEICSGLYGAFDTGECLSMGFTQAEVERFLIEIDGPIQRLLWQGVVEHVPPEKSGAA